MSMDPGTEAIDRQALERLDRIGGREFVLEMIALFLENAPQRLDAARQTLAAGDIQGLYRAAHSLKSTAANLGGRELQAASERVEAMARNGALDAIAPLLEEMERSYDHLRQSLEAEQNRRGGEYDPR